MQKQDEKLVNLKEPLDKVSKAVADINGKLKSLTLEVDADNPNPTKAAESLAKDVEGGVIKAIEQMLQAAHSSGSMFGITTIYLWRGFNLFRRGDLPRRPELAPRQAHGGNGVSPMAGRVRDDSVSFERIAREALVSRRR